MTNEERSKVREAFMQLDEVDVLLPGKDKRIMIFHDVYGLIAKIRRTQYIIYPKVPGRVFLYSMLEYD